MKTNACLYSYRRAHAVKNASSCVKTSLRVVSFLILLIAVAANSQDKNADPNAKADSGPKDVRLTIVVTGGDDKKPIDSASVYVRYVEQHKVGNEFEDEPIRSMPCAGDPAREICGSSDCRWLEDLR